MEIKPPEEQALHKEEYIELLGYSSKITDQFQKLLIFFIPSQQFEIFRAVKADCWPVRKAAMHFHMSRYNIRKTCVSCAQKIDLLRQLLEKMV